MFFVYILKCNNGSFYTGASGNIQQRLYDHLHCKGGRYTKIHKPEQLVYVEIFHTKKEALLREKEIKGWCREKKINLIKLRSLRCD